MTHLARALAVAGAAPGAAHEVVRDDELAAAHVVLDRVALLVVERLVAVRAVVRSGVVVLTVAAPELVHRVVLLLLADDDRVVLGQGDVAVGPKVGELDRLVDGELVEGGLRARKRSVNRQRAVEVYVRERAWKGTHCARVGVVVVVRAVRVERGGLLALGVGLVRLDGPAPGPDRDLCELERVYISR